jgi:sugar phosphate permease
LQISRIQENIDEITAVKSTNQSKAVINPNGNGYKWIILAILFFLQASASMAIFSFGPLAPFLQEDLGITRAQIGMFSSAIYLGMVLFGTHAGWLTDKFGVRFFLIAGTGIMGLVFISLSMTNSFIPALLIVSIAGIGYQFINPTTVKTLSDWFPPRMRATVIGFKQAAIAFGGAVAATLLPIIALSWGWRGAVIVIGLAILVAVFLCLIFYRESFTETELSDRKLVTSKSLFQTVTNRNILLQSAAGAVYCAPSIATATYLVLYLIEIIHVSVVVAGTFLMVFQVANVGGRILWGVISDRIFKGKRKGSLIIMGILMSMMSIITYFISPATPLLLIYIIFAGFGFSTGINGVHVTFLAELAGREMAATGVGFGAATSAVGMVIVPPVFGYIVDKTHSYGMAWLFLAAISAVGVILICFINEDKTLLSV